MEAFISCAALITALISSWSSVFMLGRPSTYSSACFLTWRSRSASLMRCTIVLISFRWRSRTIWRSGWAPGGSSPSWFNFFSMPLRSAPSEPSESLAASASSHIASASRIALSMLALFASACALAFCFSSGTRAWTRRTACAAGIASGSKRSSSSLTRSSRPPPSACARAALASSSWIWRFARPALSRRDLLISFRTLTRLPVCSPFRSSSTAGQRAHLSASSCFSSRSEEDDDDLSLLLVPSCCMEKPTPYSLQRPRMIFMLLCASRMSSRFSKDCLPPKGTSWLCSAPCLGDGGCMAPQATAAGREKGPALTAWKGPGRGWGAAEP
mmetsp:Transcript_56880/g.166551  ORF Transcript_56880/g.166551 Transcript_56880/m.166551 type:complete len:328 (+) Transcript_56880:1495-2478(+)